MWGSSHTWQDLENQAASFQNSTASPNSCSGHFANNFTLKSCLLSCLQPVVLLLAHPKFRPSYQITIQRHRTVHCWFTLRQTGNSWKIYTPDTVYSTQTTTVAYTFYS
jgi:hypothetical protein